MIQSKNNKDTTNYSYDGTGNLLSENSKKQITTFEYNNINQLVSKQNTQKQKKENSSYTYDKSGNLVREVLSDKKGKTTKDTTYTYNNYGKLETGTVTENGTSTTSSYEYNGDGVLIGHTSATPSGSVSKQYVADVNSETADTLYETVTRTDKKSKAEIIWQYMCRDASYRETEKTGSTALKYVYGNEKISVTIDGECDVQKEPSGKNICGKKNGIKHLRELIKSTIGKKNNIKPETYYCQTDKLGSIRTLSDKSGKNVLQTSYDDWGVADSTSFGKASYGQHAELIQEAGTNYTGYEHDDTLNLYYACDRMYDAADRRFTAKDPLSGELNNPNTMNSYIYTLDNPLRYVDPLGQSIMDYISGGLEKIGNYFTAAMCKVKHLSNEEKLVVGAVTSIGAAILMASPMGLAAAATTAVTNLVIGTVLGGVANAAAAKYFGGKSDREVIDAFINCAADGAMWRGITSMVSGGIMARNASKITEHFGSSANLFDDSMYADDVIEGAGGSENEIKMDLQFFCK